MTLTPERLQMWCADAGGWHNEYTHRERIAALIDALESARDALESARDARIARDVGEVDE